MRSIPIPARLVLPLVAAIVVAVSFAGRTTSHASGTKVSVVPASQVIKPGDPVQFDIAVTGVDNLALWQVRIHWNPAVLSFDGYVPGSFLGSTGRSPSCVAPTIDDVAGTAQFGCGTISLGPTPAGPSGDGVLAAVKFSTVAEGTSNIEFAAVQLADWDSVDCCPGFTIGEGAVTVSNSGSQPLPATPTPNLVKLTPTAIPGFTRPDELSLTPGSGSGAASQGGSTAVAGGATPVSGSGGSSGSAGSSGGGIGNISGDGASGGTGVPHAGDGTQVSSRSLAVDVLAVVLGLAGAVCLAAAYRAHRRRNAA